MASWQNFYIILGSAGAALIGIQFVVVTLVANMRKRPPMDSFSAFGTPTVVHLSGVLLISAVMTAPWPSLVSASAALATCGFAGLVYGAVVFRRTFQQTYYKPVWQDWLWYTLLPGSGYAALALGGVVLRARPQAALFVIAAATVGLLIIAIHNAWDSVTHLVVVRFGGDETESE